MLPVKTMSPLKDSKKTSAAASKIKNKILNTSSFFKVSLKMNNKALALALEAQKERSRQLEKEIVYLQKQVEALCFELATRKYKDRKLVLILKNLHSNTLQHFDMVADLFSDSDLCKPFKDRKSLFGDMITGNSPQSRFTEQLPSQPEMSVDLLCPSKNITSDVLLQTIDDISIQSRPRATTSIYKDAEKGPSNQCIQAPLTAAPHPSGSLRDEVERLSMIYSQPGLDMTVAPGPQNTQTPSVVRAHGKAPPSLTNDLSPPSVVEPESERGNKQEKTVLLNATMEMTLSNAADIVTVETQVKKTGHSGKLKNKKNKEEASQSSVKNSESKMSKVQTDSADSTLQTKDHALENIIDPEVIKPQSPKTLCKSVVTSRIPKLSKSEAGNCQKIVKNKFKSCDLTKSKTESRNIVLPDLDDYFTDPDIELSPEKDTTDEAVSKITCRRSRTKGRRMSSVTRRTFVTLPSHENESTQSNLEQLHNVVEEVVKERYEAHQDQELPDKFLFCADEVVHPASEHVEQISSSGSNMANSGRYHSSRCRGTFVISAAVDSTSSNSVSSEMGPVVQDLIPGAGSNCTAEVPSTVRDTCVIQQHSESNPQRHSERVFAEDTQSSCKRSWLATQDLESFQEDLSTNENHGELLLDQDCCSDTEFHKTKKPRREEMSQSSKKKIVHRREKGHSDVLDNKIKKKKRNKGHKSKDESRYVQELGDVSPSRGIGPERNKEHSEDVQVVDSHPYISGNDDIFEHLYDSKPTKSKSRMDLNPKQHRKKSKLYTSTETRNPRETFIVYRRKTQDRVSLNSSRASYVSDTCSDEAVHQKLGDLLMDEMPPWLALDVSTANTEAVSLLTSPTRETLDTAAVTKDPATVTAETSPVVTGRVLTSLTNTITASDSENRGRTRRRNGIVSYKEPPLNSKIRRGDKFTDSMFLSSPVFKDGKKKKKQKKNVQEPTLERSVLED